MKLTTQKAIELYKKAAPRAYHNVFSFREETHHSNCKKICHMIVDEVYNEIARIDNTFNLGLETTPEFWQEVKTEIDLIDPKTIKYE